MKTCALCHRNEPRTGDFCEQCWARFNKAIAAIYRCEHINRNGVRCGAFTMDPYCKVHTVALRLRLEGVRS